VQKVLLVFFGSGAGGVARFLIASWAVKTLGPAFPYGTIAINAIGSFLIVIIMQVSLRTDLIGPDLRLALTTGVMGGFTTYHYWVRSVALRREAELCDDIAGIGVASC